MIRLVHAFFLFFLCLFACLKKWIRLDNLFLLYLCHHHHHHHAFVKNLHHKSTFENQPRYHVPHVHRHRIHHVVIVLVRKSSHVSKAFVGRRLTYHRRQARVFVNVHDLHVASILLPANIVDVYKKHMIIASYVVTYRHRRRHRHRHLPYSFFPIFFVSNVI